MIATIVDIKCWCVDERGRTSTSPKSYVGWPHVTKGRENNDWGFIVVMVGGPKPRPQQIITHF